MDLGLGFCFDYVYCVIKEFIDDLDIILVFCFIVKFEWRG